MSEASSDLSVSAESAISPAAKRNLLVTLIGRAASITLNFLATVLVIKYLGPDRFGIYVVIVSVVTLFDLATEIPLFAIAVREMAKSEVQAPAWLSSVTRVRGFIGLVIGAVMFCVPLAVELPAEAPGALRLGGVVFLLSSLRTPATYFRARLIIHWEVVTWALSRALELGLILLIISRGGDITALMGAKVLAVGLFVLVMWAVLLGVYRVGWSGDTHPLRPLIKYSIPVGITAVLMLIQLKGDILIISALLGKTAAGTYGAVMQFPELAVVAASILGMTVGPLLARYLGQNEAERFRAVFQRVFDWIVYVVPPVCLLGTMQAAFIVNLVFDSEYLSVVPHFRIIIWVAGILPIAGLMGVTAITLNLQSRLVRVELTNVVIYLIANLVLLHYFGTIASAWIRLLVVIIGPTWTYMIIRKYGGHRLSIKSLSWVLPAGLLSAGTIYPASALHPIGALAAGLAVYVVAVLACRKAIIGFSASGRAG